MPDIIHRHSFPFREAMAALLGADQVDADSYEVRVEKDVLIVDVVNPARRDAQPREKPTAAQAEEKPEPAKQETERKGGPRAKRAGILCNEKAFQTFMEARSAEQAADELRAACGIQSRSDLDHDKGASQKFDEIERRFGLWMQGYDV